MMMTKKEEARKREAYQELLNLNSMIDILCKRMHEISLKRMKQSNCQRYAHWNNELDLEYRICYDQLTKLRASFNKIRMKYNIACIRSSKGRIMIPIWNPTE